MKPNGIAVRSAATNQLCRRFEPRLQDTGPRRLLPQVDQQQIGQEERKLLEHDPDRVGGSQGVSQQEPGGNGEQRERGQDDEPPTEAEPPAGDAPNESDDSRSALGGPGDVQGGREEGAEGEQQAGDLVGRHRQPFEQAGAGDEPVRGEGDQRHHRIGDQERHGQEGGDGMSDGQSAQSRRADFRNSESGHASRLEGQP
jgi:hypothetical protein